MLDVSNYTTGLSLFQKNHGVS